MVTSTFSRSHVFTVFLGKKASDLIQEALRSALLSTGAELTQLDGLIAVPSLAEPRFMEAHYIGTVCLECIYTKC